MELYDGALDANEITSRWYNDNRLKNYGAIINFVGVVRDEGGIDGLSFDLYEPILKAWFDRWQEVAKSQNAIILMAHSKGDVALHKSSFIAGVCSPKRKVALKLINEFVEDFKANAPIWKYDLVGDERIYALDRSQKLPNAGILASFVIIISGLSLASSIVVPFLLAVFIAIIIYPILEMMSKIHINRFFAFIILIGICGSGLWFLGNVIAGAIVQFSTDLPLYKAKIDIFIDNLIIYAKDQADIDISNNLLSFINLDKLIITTSNLRLQTGGLVTQSFLVFLLFQIDLESSSILHQQFALLLLFLSQD